jgi:hypothetical protein
MPSINNYTHSIKLQDGISALQLKQLQYESDTWKRLLGFMMDENVHLKNRLSGILMEKFDNSGLGDVENFLNRFVKADELVCLLRHDVAELDKLLVKERFEDRFIIKEMQKKIRRLRNNIKVTEHQFRKLKTDFNNYLTENI